jgi:hypothetical protein
MGHGIWTAIAASVFLTAGAALAQPPERKVAFKPGATSAELRGAIRGNDDITYRLQTAPGQVMQVLFTPSNRSCYMNVFEPGRQEAAHVGSSAGNEFARNPTLAGDYRVQVYLMRNAARRNEACRYRISFEVTGVPGGVSAGVSDRQMRDQCQARVSAMYAVRSPRIRLAAIRAGSDGPRIDGSVNKGSEGIKRFRCLFTPARELRDVMAMTPDGE